jgi:outer membrane murein-binding lipoprotein Lpp
MRLTAFALICVACLTLLVAGCAHPSKTGDATVDATKVSSECAASSECAGMKSECAAEKSECTGEKAKGCCAGAVTPE